jgi:hypothetical protein
MWCCSSNSPSPGGRSWTSHLIAKRCESALSRVFGCQGRYSRRWLLSLVKGYLWLARQPRAIARGHTIAWKSARSECARATHSFAAGGFLHRYIIRADGERAALVVIGSHRGGESHTTLMRPRLESIHMGTVGRELAGRSDVAPGGLPPLEGCSHRVVARALRVTHRSRRGSVRFSETLPPFPWMERAGRLSLSPCPSVALIDHLEHTSSTSRRDQETTASSHAPVSPASRS